MRVFGCFTVYPQEVSAELLENLLALHPEGSRWTKARSDGIRTNYFECELSKDDPKLEHLINVLKRHGCRLWQGRTGKEPGDVLFEFRRKYDTSDFEAAALLQPQPHTYVGTVDRNPDGMLLLNPEFKFRKMGRPYLHGFEIGFTVVISLIVSSTLRQKFENSDLKRLLFKPILNEESPENAPIPDYWELTSDYLMPPLVNADLNEGYYTPVEFRYRASDLCKAEEFDFALTSEYLMENWRFPVVSQRFYQFCTGQKLDMTWEPVRVDPD